MGMRIPLFRRARHQSVAVPPEFAQEQASKLVHRLFTPTGQAAPASVLFCGIERGSGCTTVCGRTAEILASQVPGTVCVVDANLEAPSLHRYFQLENREGFSDALVKSSSMQGFAQQIQKRNLWVVTCGTALDVSLAACSERLNSQILTLRTVFDYVLIDVAPANLCSDAIMLGKLVEGAVLVIQSKSATREAARQAKEILKTANVRILGAVLNKWTSPVPVKSAVANAPAQRAHPVAKQAPRKQDPPKVSGRAAVRPAPIARKAPPTNALAKASKLDIPAKRAKRRGWARFLRPVAARSVEPGRSPIKESAREASAKQVSKGGIGRQSPAQGAWKKPAPLPIKGMIGGATTASLPETIASLPNSGSLQEPPPNRAASNEPSQPVTSAVADNQSLGTAPAQKPATENLAPAATENATEDKVTLPLQRNSPTRQTPAWRSRLVAAAIGTIAAGATLWFMDGPRVVIHRPLQVSETLPVEISNPLGLQVDRNGGMLDILWDRTSATAENSNGGVVTIHDGDRVKRVRLDPGEIRTGHIYYRPRSAALDIRLEVAVEDGGTASESVLVVSAPTAGLRSFN